MLGDLESKSEYEKKLESEIKRYEELYRGRPYYDVPEVWWHVENYFSDCIKKITGVKSLFHYVGKYIEDNSKISILGLGTGPFLYELDSIIPILYAKDCDIELTCIDINDNALKRVALEAQKRNIKFNAINTDINNVILDKKRYDVIIAYASLHHFIELEYIAKEINKALTNVGIFVTVDIPTRNGYKMWEETYKIVQNIWNVLPKKYKYMHSLKDQPKYMEVYENLDLSMDSFECINSESIIPALRKNLNEIAFVPALSISRRFFDTMFGYNYDMNSPIDKSIFNFIINLDTYYIDNNILKPETFFGAYVKKSKKICNPINPINKNMTLTLNSMGPYSTTEKIGFNIQPNGESAIWFNGENFNENCIVMWENTVLNTTFLDINNVTASIPSQLYTKAGYYKIFIFDKVKYTISNKLCFTIYSKD